MVKVLPKMMIKDSSMAANRTTIIVVLYMDLHGNNIVGFFLFLLRCALLVPSLKNSALKFLQLFSNRRPVSSVGRALHGLLCGRSRV